MVQEEFEQSKSTTKKKGLSKNKLIIIALVLVLLISTGITGGIYLYNSSQKAKGATEQAKKADPEKTQRKYEELTEQVTIEVDPNDPMFRKIDFSTAQALNPDVYAWIWIPGTNIDYPILQSATEPDEYYLDHTIERMEGLPGSIYTEKYNAKDFSDPVTVIYGHNMKNGSMFADLHKFENQDFFNSNPYVYIYLPDKTYKYRIFAAVTFDDRYLMGNYNFSDLGDFQKYLDELRNSISGNVNMDISVTQQTGIITLSTCIANSPNQRLFVNATWEE